MPAFVLRACAIMEKTQKSGEGVKTSAKLAEEAADKRERIERLNGKENFNGFINLIKAQPCGVPILKTFTI